MFEVTDHVTCFCHAGEILLVLSAFIHNCVCSLLYFVHFCLFIQLYFFTKVFWWISATRSDPLFVLWKLQHCSLSLSSKIKSGSCRLLWLFSSPPELYLSLAHSLASFPLGLIRNNPSLSLLFILCWCCFCFFQFSFVFLSFRPYSYLPSISHSPFHGLTTVKWHSCEGFLSALSIWFGFTLTYISWFRVRIQYRLEVQIFTFPTVRSHMIGGVFLPFLLSHCKWEKFNSLEGKYGQTVKKVSAYNAMK